AGEAGGRGRFPWLTAWPSAVAAAAVVVLIGALALPWSRPRVIAPGPIRSIAVLPLANVSGDQSMEYLADGLTDELIGTLGRLGSINVISRTSVMPSQRSPKPVPEIAHALNVDAVLEGSVLAVPGGGAAGIGG